MAGKTSELWQTPGLLDFVIERYKAGRYTFEITKEVNERFGLDLSVPQVQSKINHAGVRRIRTLPELLEPAQGFAVSHIPPPPPKPPTGWEPRVEEHGDGTATAISSPTDTENTDHDALIRGWKLDPAFWRIVDGSLGCNRWSSFVPVFEKGKTVGYEEKWHFQYKARLADKRKRIFDASDLIAEVKKVRGKAPLVITKADSAFVAAIADTQMGKADGTGSKGIVERCYDRIEKTTKRIKDLRSLGHRIDSLYLFGMGDLIENCGDHYAQQAWRTELDRREQVKAIRRIIADALTEWAPLFPRVVVGCVGGNHGENRKDGKSFTTFADNDDVAIFDQIEEAFSYNSAAFGHVRFSIPKDELSLVFDVHGIPVGITHGHVAGKGTGAPEQKMINWWAKQSHGRQPVGNARILISAHFHHLIVKETGGRKTFIQCPALDGGSDWFRNQSGEDSAPGLLTLMVGESLDRGYAALEVL